MNIVLRNVLLLFLFYQLESAVVHDSKFFDKKTTSEQEFDVDVANELYSHRFDDLDAYKRYKKFIQSKKVDQAYQESVQYDVSESISSLNYKLVVATTFIETNSTEKNLIQQNTLRSLIAFGPQVRVVVFAPSKEYREIFGDAVDYVTDVKCNRHGTPIFRYMMMYLESRYSSSFYGYCNGDLLFHSSLVSLLSYISSHIQNGSFNERVFLVGRRTNIFAPFPILSMSDRERNDELVMQAAKDGILFQSDAEDYFIFTKLTFDWSEIKDVVIGRPGYDNYLVSQVHHKKESISFIDITNALVVAHQTDSDGVKAGHRQSKDRYYNMKIIRGDWKLGRIEYSDLIIEQFPLGTFSTRSRYYVPDVPFDDSFLQEDLDILQQYISPSSVCVELASRVIQGVLTKLCKKVIVVVYSKAFVKDMQLKFDPFKVRVLYGNASYLESGIGEMEISSAKQFQGYLEAINSIDEPIDVVINDGRCRPQAADILRRHLRRNGLLIIRGQRPHYESIKMFYSTVAEFPSSLFPGKEFQGIRVYRNNKIDTSFPHPEWW